jgi:hypothetical protein
MKLSELGIKIKKTPMGKGVFAVKSFRKEQTIGQMEGTVIAGDDYDPSYVVDLGKFGVLDPHAPFRYMNHCCEPNAALIEYPGETRSDTPTIWVEATRSIRVGEQIFIDYSWPADAAIRCLCGAPGCRGWVVSAKDAKKLQAAERKAKKQAEPSKTKASSKKPAASSKKPAASSKKPSASSKKPAASSKKPAASSKKPSASSKKPAAPQAKAKAQPRSKKASSK